jgi:3',5'-cyclic AMP phosphodiesterase CpdA
VSYVLAHISDLHLPPLPPARPGELLGKRFLSWLSWHSKRKDIHKPEILEALLQDLEEQDPDHIALTGDIVNLSLPAEFKAAAELLPQIAPPEKLSLVPGNHDYLVQLEWEESWGTWQAYLLDDEAARPPRDFADAFPYVQRRGPLVLVGLSSAVPTPPTFASGRLGEEQLNRLESLLRDLAEEGATVVILIHHSPAHRGNHRRKQLMDAADLQKLLKKYGASLVLHGHNHRFIEASLPGPRGKIPVLGVASATALAWQHLPAAHYHLLRFRDQNKVDLELRRYEHAEERFLKRDSRPLVLPDSLR